MRTIENQKLTFSRNQVSYPVLKIISGDPRRRSICREWQSTHFDSDDPIERRTEENDQNQVHKLGESKIFEPDYQEIVPVSKSLETTFFRCGEVRAIPEREGEKILI